MKIATILGTRPEIIKLSPLIPLLDKHFAIANHVLIHTGQHYDSELDKAFFKELDLRKPHYLQIANYKYLSPEKKEYEMRSKLKAILIRERPDLVLVQGDTRSAFIGADVAHELNIKIAHVEAGCRSFNLEQPEEINRKKIDMIASYLFAPDEISRNNLKNEGIDERKIFVVGNTSVDACFRNKQFAEKSTLLQNNDIQEGNYVLATIHRAESTDNKENLLSIINALNHISNHIKIVFPVHPRTSASLEKFGIKLPSSIKRLTPLPYIAFLHLLSKSRFCISDSGGVQEEAALLNIPCIVARNETEWVSYILAGKNILVGTKTNNIVNAAKELLNDAKLKEVKSIQVDYIPDASQRIVNKLKEIYHDHP